MAQLWSTKQRQGHPLHRICAYQGSFPPQLPAYFLDKFPDGVVLDPFCGRGTVVLEAALRGRTVFGFDVLPTAVLLAGVKLRCPPRRAVEAEIQALNLTGPAKPRPESVADLYHPETWRALCCLHAAPRSDALTALTLGRLHGHSAGFFSGFAFNVIGLRPARLRHLREKHGNPPLPYRAVKAILLSAARRFIPEEGVNGQGSVARCSATALPLADASVDLVITSPPFLDVIDYAEVNWLREAFISSAYVPTAFKAHNTYESFLVEVLKELRRVMRSGANAVFEIGPVKRNQRLVDVVTRSAERVGLNISAVMENDFGAASVPKISRAMHAGKETMTMKNQCVILRRGN